MGGLKQNGKSVQKSVNKTSHHYLIRQCLFSKDKNVRTMTQLLSHCHQNLVNEIDKIASSSIDDKRFLSDNSVYSLTFGHFLTGNTFNDSNERQPAWCFQNVCSSLVSPTTGFGKFFTLFFWFPVFRLLLLLLLHSYLSILIFHYSIRL